MGAVTQLLASRWDLSEDPLSLVPLFCSPPAGPFQCTFKMLMFFNKGFVGVPLTLHNT